MGKKIILFDMDGVLTFRERNFSVGYVEKFNVNPQPIMDFFATEWHNFVTGKKDLKQHILEHPDIWQWNGTPEQLFDYWFRSEDNRNEPLVQVVRRLRAKGIACYIATEQEKYRTAYVKDIMFPSEFDGCFSTCDIGYKKSDPRYFKAVLTLLQNKHPNIKVADIMYYDDDMDKLEAARQVGIDGELYVDPSHVEAAHI